MNQYLNYLHRLRDKKFIKVYLVIALVLITVLIIASVSSQKSLAPTEEPTNNESNTIPNGESNNSISNNNSNSNNNVPVIPQKLLSYSDAVKIYENKRIQFDENCVVNPSYSTFKKGTKIMLDNRASKQRQVYLSGQAYTLKAYDFKVVTLTAPKLPYTIMIDCGTGKNNGRILLQQ